MHRTPKRTLDMINKLIAIIGELADRVATLEKQAQTETKAHD